MAIVTKNPSGLKLKFDCGLDSATGKSIMKSKTYSNVRPEADNAKLYQVGESLASLQQFDLFEVARIDNSTLSK